MVKTGVMVALFGPEALTDFLHVDNMVQAHILAAKALTKAEGCKAVILISCSQTKSSKQQHQKLKLITKPNVHSVFGFDGNFTKQKVEKLKVYFRTKNGRF